MKKRGSSSSSNRINLLAPPTEDELSVCSILIDIAAITAASQSHRSQFTWSVKRKRSSLRDRAPSRRQLGQLAKPLAKPAASGGATLSPDTPFGLSPSESDGGDEEHFVVPKKRRSRRQLVGMDGQFTGEGHALGGEVDNKRKSFGELVSHNTWFNLKALEIKPTERAADVAQTYGSSSTALVPYVVDQGEAPRPGYHKYSGQLLTLIPGGMRLVTVESSWIPDLNLPAEATYGVKFCPSMEGLNIVESETDKQAKFALNRLRRKILIRVKARLKALRRAYGITVPSLLN